jgi:hypothetical protein
VVHFHRIDWYTLAGMGGTLWTGIDNQIEAYYDPNNGGAISFGDPIIHFEADNSDDEDCAGEVDDECYPVDTSWKNTSETNEKIIPESQDNVDCGEE